ncbi:MAG: sigma 54-interacting transcriptional regulator [Bacteroidota bacterium]
MQATEDGHITHIMILGAGKGGKALLELFFEDPTISIVAVVDIDPKAAGISLAHDLGIPTSQTAAVFLGNREFQIDMIVDATGQKDTWHSLKQIIDPDIRIIDGAAAKFIWALLEARTDKLLLEEKYDRLKTHIETNYNNQAHFGSNPKMREIEQMIKQVAPTRSSVLIIGETGTGKEVIAQVIQETSELKNQPFLKINCTAFVPQLLESELFGYKKGAFTGASKDKPGLLEMADGGTIFLDEIGDISLEMQVKLLRFLQFGEIRPVGSTKTKILQTRIIAATNRDLHMRIKEGAFREDLYYRLNTFTIELPPLRERPEDIPLLTHHFLQKANVKLNKKVRNIEAKAMELLCEYSFPGNLRELQSIIERAVILCQGSKILPEHLPMFIQNVGTLVDFSEGFAVNREKVIDQFERRAVQHYLMEANGNVSKAALLARVPRRSFYRIMERLNLNKSIYSN